MTWNPLVGGICSVVPVLSNCPLDHLITVHELMPGCVCLVVCLSVRLSLRLSICLCLSACLSVTLFARAYLLVRVALTQ